MYVCTYDVVYMRVCTQVCMYAYSYCMYVGHMYVRAFSFTAKINMEKTTIIEHTNDDASIIHAAHK